MWVIKLGGSLTSSPRLTRWLQVLTRHGGGRAVLVPGGGPFADTVRQTQREWHFPDGTAHNMALLAMNQYALMLSGIEPALVTADSDTTVRNALAAGKVPVWLPVPMALQDGHIEASWRVTSDSLALWLARRLNAERLVLIKSVLPAPGKSTIDDLIQEAIVDRAFGDFAQQTDCEIRLLGPEDHALLTQALRTGSRTGIAITR